MILADDEIQFHMATGPDGKVDGSGLTIELVRLVLRFHHEAFDIGDFARNAFANAPAMGPKNAASYLER